MYNCVNEFEVINNSNILHSAKRNAERRRCRVRKKSHYVHVYSLDARTRSVRVNAIFNPAMEHDVIFRPNSQMNLYSPPREFINCGSWRLCIFYYIPAPLPRYRPPPFISSGRSLLSARPRELAAVRYRTAVNHRENCHNASINITRLLETPDRFTA